MKSNMRYNNSNNKFSNDEQQALTYLKSINYKWYNAFIEVLQESRDKISQRLITSIHRENLAYSRNHSHIITSQNAPYDLTGYTHLLKIHFQNAHKTLYAPITGQHAFDRIDVEGPFYFEYNNSIERIIHPNDILACILIEAPSLNNDASKQFSDDLNNSVANMAISLSFQKMSLANESQPLAQLIIDAEDSYLRSEQSVVEGHPLHPGAKLRKGMTSQTTILYSSEFNNTINLKFLLIHKDIAKVSSLSNDYNDILYDLFRGLDATAIKEVGSSNLESYYVMVVHPWQLDEIITKQYSVELKNQQIIILPYHLNYFSGLSFRTLMPKLPMTSPHIKLSTNVHITGELRTLSEQTTINGPIITHILNDIKKRDSLFHSISADTLDEIAGIHYFHPNHLEDNQIIKSEQLGSLFRTNIYDVIDKHTTPMISSSLVAQYPNNYETPITSLIFTYMRSNHFDDYKTACITWMKHYIQALVDITMPLYIKYGIALEAHLQNVVASFNTNGSLNKLYIRDFEGLRIDEIYLNKMGYSTDYFHENSLVLTDHPQTVFNKVFYSTIQNHLGELIANITKFSDIDYIEQNLWSCVADILLKKINAISNTMDNPKRINDIRSTFFEEKIDYKCVTTMRLEDEADIYTYTQVNNPLHRYDSQN